MTAPKTTRKLTWDIPTFVTRSLTTQIFELFQLFRVPYCVPVLPRNMSISLAANHGMKRKTASTYCFCLRMYFTHSFVHQVQRKSWVRLHQSCFGKINFISGFSIFPVSVSNLKRIWLRMTSTNVHNICQVYLPPRSCF